MIRTLKDSGEKWILHVDATVLGKFSSPEAAYLWLARQPDPLPVTFEVSVDPGFGDMDPTHYIPKEDLHICSEGYFNTL